jgi:hypothetical protein
LNPVFTTTKGETTMNWLTKNNTVVTLSTVSLLLMLERVFLDFRYVALEMEAPNAMMPFTAPYMAFAFLIFGSWIWALLAAQQGRRGALIALLALSLLNLVFGVSTVAFLCPTPCQTASPITDILVYAQIVVSLAAMVSAGLARWGSAPMTASAEMA